MSSARAREAFDLRRERSRGPLCRSNDRIRSAGDRDAYGGYAEAKWIFSGGSDCSVVGHFDQDIPFDLDPLLETSDCRLYSPWRDRTLTDVTQQAGLLKTGWACGILYWRLRQPRLRRCFRHSLGPERSLPQPRRWHLYGRSSPSTMATRVSP